MIHMQIGKERDEESGDSLAKHIGNSSSVKEIHVGRSLLKLKSTIGENNILRKQTCKVQRADNFIADKAATT